MVPCAPGGSPAGACDAHAVWRLRKNHAVPWGNAVAATLKDECVSDALPPSSKEKRTSGDAGSAVGGGLGHLHIFIHLYSYLYLYLRLYFHLYLYNTSTYVYGYTCIRSCIYIYTYIYIHIYVSQ